MWFQLPAVRGFLRVGFLCWGVFGVGFLVGEVEQIGIVIWFGILTLKKILLTTLFLHFHTNWVNWLITENFKLIWKKVDNFYICIAVMTALDKGYLLFLVLQKKSCRKKREIEKNELINYWFLCSDIWKQKMFSNLPSLAVTIWDCHSFK